MPTALASGTRANSSPMRSLKRVGPLAQQLVPLDRDVLALLAQPRGLPRDARASSRRRPCPASSARRVSALRVGGGRRTRGAAILLVEGLTRPRLLAGPRRRRLPACARRRITSISASIDAIASDSPKVRDGRLAQIARGGELVRRDEGAHPPLRQRRCRGPGFRRGSESSSGSAGEGRPGLFVGGEDARLVARLERGRLVQALTPVSYASM